MEGGRRTEAALHRTRKLAVRQNERRKQLSLWGRRRRRRHYDSSSGGDRAALHSARRLQPSHALCHSFSTFNWVQCTVKFQRRCTCSLKKIFKVISRGYRHILIKLIDYFFGIWHSCRSITDTSRMYVPYLK